MGSSCGSFGTTVDSDTRIQSLASFIIIIVVINYFEKMNINKKESWNGSFNKRVPWDGITQ